MAPSLCAPAGPAPLAASGRNQDQPSSESRSILDPGLLGIAIGLSVGVTFALRQPAVRRWLVPKPTEAPPTYIVARPPRDPGPTPVSSVPGGYPDGPPEIWTREVLPQEVRGEGTLSRYSNGDYVFYSSSWLTLHGEARVLRSDTGAFMVWGALMPEGRRVHCRRSTGPTGGGIWRRRSDDGRSWTLGELRLAPDEVFFSDGIGYRNPIHLDDNPFERAMASKPEFIKALQDDAFAFTLNLKLWVESLCTLDGSTCWNPSRGEAAESIAKLRGFGETYADFKFGGPYPEPPRVATDVITAALEAAGWRFQTEEEWRRYEDSALLRKP